MGVEPTVDGAVERVLELDRLCRIGTLRDYRVTGDMIVPMAAKAMEDGKQCKTGFTRLTRLNRVLLNGHGNPYRGLMFGLAKLDSAGGQPAVYVVSIL